ncbi:MAG: glycosyltransferase [Sporomusaceae bacterium]|nr:glycosyltransferase [Sporomusaceae bacterium]
MDDFAVVIPTRNGGAQVQRLFASLQAQSLQPQQVLVIDSTSKDQTAAWAKEFGFHLEIIPAASFNHGGTRQSAATQLAVSFLIYLTQDVLLADSEAFAKLLRPFQDSSVSAVYGRQLPHQNAGLLGAHARIFNYGPESVVKSLDDAPRYGLKTAFLSNSFAAYRRSDLIAVGGFPATTILSEDMYVAAKLLLAGKKIAYQAEAKVYHSHDYTMLQEFQRYFDIGVFQARELWIRETFGQAEGEGARFVKSELAYLWCKGAILQIPGAMLRTLAKFLGYRLGFKESKIPLYLKKKFSMCKGYWRQ